MWSLENTNVPPVNAGWTLLNIAATHSVWPWKTLTECIEGSLKSHSLKVVSRDDVTTSLWVGWVQQCVSSWSWPGVERHIQPNQPAHLNSAKSVTPFKFSQISHLIQLNQSPHLKSAKCTVFTAIVTLFKFNQITITPFKIRQITVTC